MINNCVRQKKREISSDDKFWNLGSFGGNFWKKVHIDLTNEMSWGNFLGIGLEPRELHSWIAPERCWSFRKVIRLCHDSKSEWQVGACDLKIMALPYTYVKDAKVHYFIAGRRGRKEVRKEGRKEGAKDVLHVFFHFSRDTISLILERHPAKTIKFFTVWMRGENTMLK